MQTAAPTAAVALPAWLVPSISLPPLQAQIFRGRYLSDVAETSEQACARLGIEQSQYDEALSSMLRRMRTAKPEPVSGRSQETQS